YYTELTSPSLTTPSLTLSNVPQNRYFQYRAFFNNMTTSNTISPYLKSTTTSYSLPSPGGELTDVSCINLSPYLVQKYLVDIPYDPSRGDSTKTYYAVKKTDNRRITIEACSPEYNASINVTR
ncbi:MAG: hypothetical protein V1652_02135, partial [bacterium]